MPTVAIEGIGKVELGDEFMKLAPEQQDATIQEIAASHRQQQPQTPKDHSLLGGIQDIWNKPDGLSLIGMAKSAYEGLKAPGEAAQGKFSYPTATPGVQTEEEAFLQNIGRQQEMGAASKLAGVTGLASAPSVAARSAVKPSAPALGEIANAATKGYNEFKSAGGEFSPEISNALADKIGASLKEHGSFQHLADPVFKTVDLLRKDSPVSLDEIKSIREGLNSLKVDADSKVRRAANTAADEMTQFLKRTEPQAGAALEKADANYAAAARTKQLNVAEDVADLRTGRAGYGGNSVNAMRQVLSPIVEKAIKGRSQGFSKDEIQAMRDIVEGTATTNFLRGLGQLSPSKGSISTGIAIGTGGVTAGLGAGANKLASVLTGKQFERLNELVRKRSPAYEEAVGKATDKYLSSADQFVLEPSQKNFIQTVIAARALASGLTRDGIGVNSGDLLKRIQGPVQSPAQDEQPQP